MTEATNPKPLAIGCRASRCDEDVPAAKKRHAFGSPISELPGLGGACLGCGGQGLVDWDRCHQRDPGDVSWLTSELRLELIRDNYWGLPLPDHVFHKADKRTPDQLATSVERTLRRTLKVNHFREGYQTRFAYNQAATIIECAQHATATCCRACLEKWFGFPRLVPLKDGELGYLGNVVWNYIDRRLSEPRQVDDD